MKPANIIKRFLAYIVDLVILYSLTLVLLQVIYLLIYVSTWGSGGLDFKSSLGLLKQIGIPSIITNCLFPIYFSFFESYKSQATLGKEVFKLYVSNTKNEKLTFRKSFFRFLIWQLPIYISQILGKVYGDHEPKEISEISYLGIIDIKYYINFSHVSFIDPLNLIFLIGIIWYVPIFFTKERKTLYDMLSSTRVYAKPSAIDKLKEKVAEQEKLINELKERLETQ